MLGFLAAPIKRSRLLSRAYSSNDTFLNGSASTYVEAMQEAWKKDPNSVHVSWRAYFNALSGNVPPGSAFVPPPVEFISGRHFPVIHGNNATNDTFDIRKSIQDHMKVQLLVRGYQVRGHRRSNLDPLAIQRPETHTAPELDLSFYGFTEKDLDRSFHLGDGILSGFRKEGQIETLKLREIVSSLQETYCGTLGIEYTHIPEREHCDWIRSCFEIPLKYQYTKEQQSVILDRLTWSDSFERYVHTKYAGERRFGLEGCEALIPGMKAMIDTAAETGVEEVVLGMPHRGRLNVLSNLVRKPFESIFCEFNGTIQRENSEGTGDVKYHLGMNYIRPTLSGKTIRISLVANPSHLEAVDPVVLGKTRALQFYKKDEVERKKVIAILIHGDASFAAQGVVYESMGFADLPSYTTGGTIHVIVNNQIGFTTDPRLARSTPYCSDIARAIRAPIVHVNGDDVEAVVFACQWAIKYRQRFKKDVVIDIVCYRRHGHNEFDEPMFTQPLMYKTIAKKKRVLDIYSEYLISKGIFTQSYVEENKKRVWKILEDSYEKSKTYQPTSKEWVTSNWDGFRSPKEMATYTAPVYGTGVDVETLKHVGKLTATYPKEFDIHRGLAKILDARLKSTETGEGIDMPTAECLAFGTLLLEGNHVRLSGQDVERGTFSQRHAVLNDQSTEARYVPLEHISPTQASFTVCNSSLSEYGVLGFDLGYSLVHPHCLVLWEAQFGDFCNNAQVIIDQFISSGEQKWHQRTGLTMLLPHGFDGAGPEHSSARMERFLQLCDEHPSIIPELEKNRQIQDCNMQVVYCSTPANYFHAIRRQIHRDFRKPLIVFNSKSLMRHPMARSTLGEFQTGTQFTRVYPEVNGSIKNVKKLVFCCGQIYYALAKARELNKVTNVAIARVEQLAPFPFDLILEELKRFPDAQVVWCQEEPMNMGAWDFVSPRLKACLNSLKRSDDPSFIGRLPTAAVATGLKHVHVKEEHAIVGLTLLDTDKAASEVVAGVPVWKK